MANIQLERLISYCDNFDKELLGIQADYEEYKNIRYFNRLKDLADFFTPDAEEMNPKNTIKHLFFDSVFEEARHNRIAYDENLFLDYKIRLHSEIEKSINLIINKYYLSELIKSPDYNKCIWDKDYEDLTLNDYRLMFSIRLKQFLIDFTNEFSSKFTLRQREVAKLVLDGLSIDQMARELSTSDETIKSELEKLRKKTGTVGQKREIFIQELAKFF